MATAEQIDAALKRLKGSASFRAAEKKLDFWAVVLFATRGPVPRTFGDNRGWWPGRVGITKDPEEYEHRADLEQRDPHTALQIVWTESQRHAARLKAKLDGLLLGEGGANRIRNAWRDLEDPDITWPILLGQALDEIRADGEVVNVFDENERVRRILHEARKRGRG